MTSKTKQVEAPSLLPFADDKDNLLLNALKIGASGVTIKRISSVSELLADRDSILVIVDMASEGASIETIEMALGFLPGILRSWLKNGIEEVEGPFYVFRQLYLTAASQARMSAEKNLLAKNPEKWLAKYDPLQDLPPTYDAESEPTNTGVEYKEF